MVRLVVVVVSVSLIVTVMMELRKQVSLDDIVPYEVGGNAVLDIASCQTLFMIGPGVLSGVDSPSQESSEEHRSSFSHGYLLVKVVLEEFLGLSAIHF